MATISLSKLDLSGIEWLALEPEPVAPADEIESKRSDLPCPRIILDRVEYLSHANGQMITSRSQHRDHLKRHGLIELGNEKIDVKGARKARHAKLRASLRDDIMQSVKDYKEGKRSEKAPSAETAGFTNVSTTATRVAPPRPTIIHP